MFASMEKRHRMEDLWALYDSWYPNVLAYCARRVGREEASDVAADVFAMAWQRLDAAPGGEESLPWLYAAPSRRRRLPGRVGTPGRW